MPEKKTILVVDDDFAWTISFQNILEEAGFDVKCAASISEAKQILQDQSVDLAILDVKIPTVGVPDMKMSDVVSSKGGFESGLLLGKWIKSHDPSIHVVGTSIDFEKDTKNWFENNGSGCIYKTANVGPDVIRTVSRALKVEDSIKYHKILIVHGGDQTSMLDLKDYLQNTLGFPEPISLDSLPSIGRTFIEKIEEEAYDISFVFVLLTPDDDMAERFGFAPQKQLPSQNVIFELGYFMGLLGRYSGRVILLYRKPIELPSDLSGIVCIDITEGVHPAGETIRKEIQHQI